MMRLSFLYLLLLMFVNGTGSGDARKGNEAYNNGNFEEAEVLFRAAIEQNPDNARFYFNLGNALAKQGKIEEAVSAYMDFENLTDDPDELALAEYSIGTILAGEENWKPAKMHLRNALRYNPGDTDAKLNYELAALKAEQEENEEQQDQEDQENQPPPEPSEYAIAMKTQAEKLVEQHYYNLAYDLMTTARKVDPTIAAFNDFIERIGNVDKIDPEQ